MELVECRAALAIYQESKGCILTDIKTMPVTVTLASLWRPALHGPSMQRGPWKISHSKWSGHSELDHDLQSLHTAAMCYTVEFHGPHWGCSWDHASTQTLPQKFKALWMETLKGYKPSTLLRCRRKQQLTHTKAEHTVPLHLRATLPYVPLSQISYMGFQWHPVAVSLALRCPLSSLGEY